MYFPDHKDCLRRRTHWLYWAYPNFKELFHLSHKEDYFWTRTELEHQDEHSFKKYAYNIYQHKNKHINVEYAAENHLNYNFKMVYNTPFLNITGQLQPIYPHFKNITLKYYVWIGNNCNTFLYFIQTRCNPFLKSHAITELDILYL